VRGSSLEKKTRRKTRGVKGDWIKRDVHTETVKFEKRPKKLKKLRGTGEALK